MKTFDLINILYLLLLSQRDSKLIEFSKFVGKNFNPTETVKRNCSWQYAIIKVEVNKVGIITSYTVENKTSGDLANSFKYLTGYKFSAVPAKKEVICFVSLESKRTDACDIAPTNTHSLPNKLFEDFKLQNNKKGYKGIYIDKIIYSIIYDPIN